MTKQDAVELLQKQLPGFYSAEQVIDIINSIDESKSKIPMPNENEIESIVKTMAEEICDQADNLIDDYDLEMNGREVEMTSLTLDQYTLKRYIIEFLENNDIVMFKKQDEE